MRAFGYFETRWPGLVRAATDRLRAIGWRLRGARLGGKTRIGSRCMIDQPWLLSTGLRVQIEHNVFIKIVARDAKVSIGEHTFVGTGTVLDAAQAIEIGDHVLIAPGCFISDHTHRHGAPLLIDAQGSEVHAVRICHGAWLGAHAVVLPGVTIGEGAIVGAGAVVTSDVQPNSIVAGVPARAIGKRPQAAAPAA
jgi:acetyltransferase-like isoleucine patch superfamily enzyme